MPQMILPNRPYLRRWKLLGDRHARELGDAIILEAKSALCALW